MAPKSRGLRDIAEEIVARLDTPNGDHDVSNEPRVPKGNGRQSGEWTSGGQSDSADASDQASGNCPNGSIVVPMVVTAYTNGPESTDKRPGDHGYGITKSKVKAGPGTIAAPPAYGFKTRMFVPGYGWGTMQDRGVAIQDSHLDVWFEKVEDARRWGRQHLNVIICK